MPRNRLTATLLAAAALSALPGCWTPGYTPGGQGASRDLFTYQSTPDSLKSVSLLNTMTGETVWQIDVPVDHVVVIRFYDNDETSSTPKNSLMRWQIMTPFDASLGGDLNNVIPCPGRGSRQLVMNVQQPEHRRPAATPPPAPLPPPEPAGAVR
jgi:hypothetical protein